MSKKDLSAFAIASLIMGAVSLILGVASLSAWLLPFCGLPLSVAGLVLGFVAKSSRRHGVANAGIGMCAVGVVLAITGFVLGLTLYAPPTISPEIEKRIIARQIVRFGEAYGDLVIKDASMEIRGRGSILPEDKANGIDQLVCYQVYISFVTKTNRARAATLCMESQRERAVTGTLTRTPTQLLTYGRDTVAVTSRFDPLIGV